MSSDSESDNEQPVAGPSSALLDLGETLKSKTKAAAAQTQKPGVVYLGRIPRGFYEDQMQRFFSQFGEVTRLRLSRNRKTGASRHYAFIEFASLEVARIVAETMHNYLLLGHMLQCHVVEEDRQHPRMFVGANKRMRPYPAQRVAKEQVNADKPPKARARIARRSRKADAAKRERIAAQGIEYDFP